MIRIDARDGLHYATLVDTTDGVRVCIWRYLQRKSPGMAVRLHAMILECPFHVALDRVHNVMHDPTTFNQEEV